MTIYINAKVVATAIKNASTANSPGFLNGSIGNLGGPLSQGFNGTIDELMIYNRSLTANEVYYHYWRRAHPVNGWSTKLGESQPSPTPGPYPRINFTSFGETPVHGASVVQNITVNVTAEDTDLNKITAYLYNDSEQIQFVESATSPLNYRFVTPRPGTYYVNASAIDEGNQENRTETRTIYVSDPALADTPLCTDVALPLSSCLVVTKLGSCATNNYSMYNLSYSPSKATLYKSGYNLQQFDGSFYYFTFNEPQGDYLIEYCDAEERQIRSARYSIAQLSLGVQALKAWGEV